jgi:hypothetical protein
MPCRTAGARKRLGHARRHGRRRASYPRPRSRIRADAPVRIREQHCYGRAAAKWQARFVIERGPFELADCVLLVALLAALPAQPTVAARGLEALPEERVRLPARLFAPSMDRGSGPAPYRLDQFSLATLGRAALQRAAAS